MNARARAIAVVAILAQGVVLQPLSTGPSVAQAQDATAEARKRFQEGVKLFDEKKYDQARAAFLQAYALKRHPDILLNLAQSEQAGGRPLEAAMHYRDFLRDPATSTHPKRVDTERNLAEVRLRLGSVKVLIDTADAEIFIDGARVGVSPLPEAVDVAPGNHLVEARQGARTITRSVNAPAGHIVPVDMRFGTSAVPPPPPPPTTAAPPTPPAPTSDPASNPPPASTTTPPDDRPPPPPPPGGSDAGPKPGFASWAFGTPVGLIGTGLFLGGLGVGGAFSVLALGSKGEAEDLRSEIQTNAGNDARVPANQKNNPCAEGNVAPGYESQCQEASDAFDSNKSQRLIATIGLAAAGAGLVTLTVGYLMAGPKTEGSTSGRAPAPRAARLRVSPLLGPSTTGLGFSGSF
ncbi:MAG TPA: hypothetical protein VFS00_04440 [Polyangiaceae bacterium]|nr:hypothetical protein [Polyangiaceae bacterium]